MNLRAPLLLLACALALSACANKPPRTASGRNLKLETVYRPHRPPTYQYRAVDQ